MRHIQGQDYVGEQLEKARKGGTPFDDYHPKKRHGCLGSILTLLEVALHFITQKLLGRGASQDDVEILTAGHQGEQAVVTALSALDDRWVLFSGVVLERLGGDIDKVLVGPGGVFALEVKNWSGEIFYDKQTSQWSRLKRYSSAREPVQTDPAEQAQRNARALQRVLRYDVSPVVVFVNPNGSFTGQHPSVAVVMLPALVGWLRGRPALLTAADINHLEEKIKKAMRA